MKKQPFFLFYFLLCWNVCISAQNKISFEKALADLETQNDSVYYPYPSCKEGSRKEEILETNVINAATDKQLDSLAINATIPAIRLLAYETLLGRDKNRCIALLPKLINDKSKVYFDSSRKPILVRDYIVGVSANNIELFDSRSVEIIDSMVLISPNICPVGYIDGALERCSGKPKFYQLFCDLYNNGRCDMLSYIAKYRKEHDMDKIITALRDYKMNSEDIEDDKEGEVLIEDGCLNSGLSAVIEWPNKEFIPIIEEIGKYIFSRKGFYYNRGKFFFCSLMAYDNDWAYNLIEEYMKNKKTQKYYSSIFTEAFRISGRKKRYIPLVMKYGDKETLNYNEANEK